MVASSLSVFLFLSYQNRARERKPWDGVDKRTRQETFACEK